MIQVVKRPDNAIPVDVLDNSEYRHCPVVFETSAGYRGRLVTNPITKEWAIISAVSNDATFRGITGDTRTNIIKTALDRGNKVYIFAEIRPAVNDHNAWTFLANDPRLIEYAANPNPKPKSFTEETL